MGIRSKRQLHIFQTGLTSQTRLSVLISGQEETENGINQGNTLVSHAHQNL
jgi:hypothetical protein